MRTFPRRSRHRLATLAIAGALALTGLVAPQGGSASAAPDDLKDRQHRIEKKIERAHDDLEHSSAQVRRRAAALRRAQAALADARAELAAAQRRLTAARIRDQQMREALAEAQAKLAAAEAEVEQGRADTEQQRLRVEDMVVATFQKGDPDLLAIEGLMNAETAQELTFSEIANEAIAADQTMSYDELRASLVLLQVREAEVERARDDVAVKRQAAADHLQVSKGLESEARESRDVVAGLAGKAATAKHAADRARAADRRVLQRLRVQESRIAARIRRAQLAALRRARARSAANARRSAPSGVLSSPVRGAYITSPYGYRIHPIYGYWGLHDGVDFSTGGCGAPLRATTDGVVAERYYSSVYGNRLYLNNGIRRGVGLTSVYNHASSYTVGEGEWVERGEIIGYLGNTGWSTACHLHFTVLANGATTDPMRFL